MSKERKEHKEKKPDNIDNLVEGNPVKLPKTGRRQKKEQHAELEKDMHEFING